ncbi:MAG: sigma 54-interacting transcriptional regulator [Myxococcota bacterium]
MGKNDETVREASAPEPKPRGTRLYVMGPDRFEALSLPEAGTWVIGRGDGADVRLEVAAASRRHAVLHFGPQIRVEDAGSANGTIVRGQRLGSGETALLAPGDWVEIAGFTLTVALDTAQPKEARLWPHGYFEACLATELKADDAAVEVVRIRLDRPLKREALAAALVQDLRADELAAEYGPEDLELLLIGRSPEVTSTLIRDLSERLKTLGAKAKTGIARFPGDALHADELIAIAGDAMRGSPKKSGSSVVISDPAMERLHRLIERVAVGSISVLILGETGTGKEVIAETIHKKSPRAQKELVRLNCAALPESLIESELFGHEKGAFTGASRQKPGLIETASGGTLFIDEIGELPPTIQVKLLRVLEQRQVLRVGGLKPIDVDLRVISATHRSMEDDVAAGRFRQDLYFRLNGITLEVPPLRERTGEIRGLAELFIQQVAAQDGLQAPRLSEEALAVMMAYRWPGNIRELKNVVERAVLLSGGEAISPSHLPLERMRPGPQPSPEPKANAEAEAPPGKLEQDLRAFERERILRALEATQGNQTRAAELLGIARRTLINRLEEYQIDRPRKRPKDES